ncbi:FAD:protein FMN transferase [Poseidonocella sedimentorum]|nr:FAD:protein FMN transferase [Poseidonocella sedimentorum]
MKFSRRSFIVMSLALAACKRGANVLELSGSTMGTSFSVVAVDHEGAADKAAVSRAIDTALAQVNQQMSNWDAGSEVSRFNAARTTGPIAVSPELGEVVSAALDVHAASDGQFDITLGSAIEAWGFGATGAADGREPSAALLAAAAGTHGLSIEGGAVRKAHPETQIYLSSIGKGFGVDQVAGALRGFGLKDFMVEIGGDLYVSGNNADGQPWQIGIESPDALSRQAYDIASISNLGMATSGDYRNYFEKDGARYSHILDARTGRPVTHNTASVTVLAENAMLADAWATALLAVGTERGLEIANQRDLAAMFIDRDGKADHVGYTRAESARFAALKA